MTEVLVLNASYEPIRIIPARRALVLLLQRKAELVESGNEILRSAGGHYTRPLVVRLLRYIALPRMRQVACSRRAVILRDRETCQYCGAQPGRAYLTIDHIVPRARGGQTVWENVVAACVECNRRKGDRTLDQAGMRLRSAPRRPLALALTLGDVIERNAAWRKYAYVI